MRTRQGGGDGNGQALFGWGMSRSGNGRASDSRAMLIVLILATSIPVSCFAICDFAPKSTVQPTIAFKGPIPSDSSWSEASICRIGDVDHDGVDDLVLVSAYVPKSSSPDANVIANHDSAGVHVLSGANGAILYAVDSPAESSRFGEAVCFIGDFDGDGVGDFAVGAPGPDSAERKRVGPVPPEDCGMVFLCSGCDGSMLANFHGTSEAERFGASLCPLGDIDGDGRSDLAIGVPQAPGVEEREEYQRNGKVIIVSTRTGKILSEVCGRDRDHLGLGISCCGDVDADGIADILATGWEFAALISPRTGGILREIGPTYLMDSVQQSAPVDLDQDGCPDLVLGQFTYPKFESTYRGSVRVYSGRTGKRLQSFNRSGRGAALVTYPGDTKTFCLVTSDGSTVDFTTPSGRISARIDVPQPFTGSVVLLGDIDRDGVPEVLLVEVPWDEGKSIADRFLIYSVGRELQTVQR